MCQTFINAKIINANHTNGYWIFNLIIIWNNSFFTHEKVILVMHYGIINNSFLIFPIKFIKHKDFRLTSPVVLD